MSSYNRLGKDADEEDADEIIEMASKASLSDQQIQVQENVHGQIKAFCTFMDEILLPNDKTMNDPQKSSQQVNNSPRRSGLSLAVARSAPPTNHPGLFFFLSFYVLQACFEI